MAFNPYRKITAEDLRNVEHTAERFCIRHAIPLNSDFGTWLGTIECHIDAQEFVHGESHLGRLWARCLARALQVPHSRKIGIAHGYVGEVAE